MASEGTDVYTAAVLPLAGVPPPEIMQRTLSTASSLFEPLDTRAEPLGVFPQYVSNSAVSLKLTQAARNLNHE